MALLVKIQVVCLLQKKTWLIQLEESKREDKHSRVYLHSVNNICKWERHNMKDEGEFSDLIKDSLKAKQSQAVKRFLSQSRAKVSFVRLNVSL